MCLIIFLLSLRTGDKDIVRSDVVLLVLSLTSLFLWLVVKQPVWSVILINTAEVLGVVPTVRKSWNRPYSETLFTYELSIFRQALTLFALQAINILTALTPITWVTVNVVITAILVVRRKQMPRPSAAGNVVAENTIVDEVFPGRLSVSSLTNGPAWHPFE